MRAGRICAFMLFALSLLGCSFLGLSNSAKTLEEVSSSDGKHIAQLVVLRNEAANKSDAYFVVVTSHRLEKSALEKLRWSDPPLYMTRGWNLKIRWISPNELEVNCSTCNLNKMDVMEKRPVADGVVLSYVGFPVANADNDK